ncbi:MAG: RHS repeat domain-containing protein, partial [Angustibacter sp.]
MTRLTYPDNSTVDYLLHAGGAVLAIPGFAEELDYAADGGVLGYLLPEGGRVETPRDASGRLLAVRARPDTGAIHRELSFAYGPDASLIRITDTAPAGVEVSDFSYDPLHRLVGARVTSPGGAIVRNSDYRYDEYGNLLDFGDLGGAQLAYADAAHPGRVTNVTRLGQTAAVSYGARGEITETERLANIHLDAFDRMTSVDGPESSLRFRYDPQNRRVAKEVLDANGEVISRTRYLAGLWEESAERTARHVFLGTHLLATVESGVTPLPGEVPQTRFHLADHLGTIIASLSGAGEVLAWQRYAPFGASLAGPGGPNRFLGRELDQELGLVQLGARWYDPSLGRFISADWYVLENPAKVVRLPQGFAVYSYALNNPLSFKDPSGLWFGLDDLIVAAVGFVVGFVTGLIYGLANGQGWGSLLTALETGLTTAAGAWLGWTIGGPVGMVMGGM